MYIATLHIFECLSIVDPSSALASTLYSTALVSNLLHCIKITHESVRQDRFALIIKISVAFLAHTHGC